MLAIQTCNRKVASSSLGPAGILGGGSECTVPSPSSIPRRGALEQGTEPPTAPRAPQHKGLPTAVRVRACVCVCALGWVNAEHGDPEYGSPYLAVCHVTFTYRHTCETLLT